MPWRLGIILYADEEGLKIIAQKNDTRFAY